MARKTQSKTVITTDNEGNVLEIRETAARAPRQKGPGQLADSPTDPLTFLAGEVSGRWTGYSGNLVVEPNRVVFQGLDDNHVQALELTSAGTLPVKPGTYPVDLTKLAEAASNATAPLKMFQEGNRLFVNAPCPEGDSEGGSACEITVPKSQATPVSMERLHGIVYPQANRIELDSATIPPTAKVAKQQETFAIGTVGGESFLVDQWNEMVTPLPRGIRAPLGESVTPVYATPYLEDLAANPSYQSCTISFKSDTPLRMECTSADGQHKAVSYLAPRVDESGTDTGLRLLQLVREYVSEREATLDAQVSPTTAQRVAVVAASAESGAISLQCDGSNSIVIQSMGQMRSQASIYRGRGYAGDPSTLNAQFSVEEYLAKAKALGCKNACGIAVVNGEVRVVDPATGHFLALSDYVEDDAVPDFAKLNRLIEERAGGPAAVVTAGELQGLGKALTSPVMREGLQLGEAFEVQLMPAGLQVCSTSEAPSKRNARLKELVLKRDGRQLTEAENLQLQEIRAALDDLQTPEFMALNKLRNGILSELYRRKNMGLNVQREEEALRAIDVEWQPLEAIQHDLRQKASAISERVVWKQKLTKAEIAELEALQKRGDQGDVCVPLLVPTQNVPEGSDPESIESRVRVRPQFLKTLASMPNLVPSPDALRCAVSVDSPMNPMVVQCEIGTPASTDTFVRVQAPLYGDAMRVAAQEPVQLLPPITPSAPNATSKRTRSRKSPVAEVISDPVQQLETGLGKLTKADLFARFGTQYQFPKSRTKGQMVEAIMGQVRASPDPASAAAALSLGP